jgi:hypothetical protein
MKHPDLEEKPMSTRTSIIALAAVAGLGAAALVPTSAAARGGGFGHGGGSGHAPTMHRAMGHSPVVHRPVVHRSAHLPIKSGLHKLPIKSGLKPGPKFAKHGPHKHWCHHHHCYYPWWYVGPNYVVDIEPETAVVESVAASVAAPVQRTDNCNCLTKQYLPDGAVLFTDVCTKEEALATPEQLKAQAQGPTPRPIPR